MICSICNGDIHEEDELNCTSCNGFFNFGCATLRESAFRKLSKTARQKWCCMKCKLNTDSKLKLPIKNTLEDKETMVLTIEAFNSLTNSVNFMSAKFDLFGKQLQEIIQSMKDIKEENKVLKEQNINLRNDFNALFKKTNYLEQKSIENFVEIVGVPKIDNEDCKTTVKKIATSLNMEIDIVSAFRVQSKFNNKPNKIVAEVTLKQYKRDLIDPAKKIKLTGNRVDSNWKNDPIYINDNLTQFNRNLFFKSKAFARESGYSFVWFKDSKIFIKNNENSKAFLIGDDLYLTKLKQTVY